MKKKLEAELISIAHRILKLKNRAELDQLQQETLKLYEKISVLRFVEDNFSDVKPTIGYSSAEETLEEIYGIEEQPEVKANEVEAEEEKKKAEAKAKKAEEAEGKSDKAEESGEGVTADKEEAPAAEVEEAETEEEAEPKTEDAEEEPAVEEAEEEEAEEQEEESVVEEEEQEIAEPKAEEEVEQPEVKVEVEKPASEIKAMEEAAAAVFEKEDESTIEEEEKAADAEIKTIEPDSKAKVEDSGLSFDFAFERPAALEEPVKQKEITFEDYHDYKEPEFVKKDEANAPKSSEAVKEEPKQEEAKQEYKDWRDWEPSKSEPAQQDAQPVKEEPKKEEPKVEEPKQEAPKEEPKQEGSTVKGNIATRTDFDKPKSLNDSFGKSITLGLNDRIAFEKNLFGGSADDLNRVLSQLATMNTFDEAKEFIVDLVKPDYNNWNGKEEYEERFMAIVEKKFN